MRNGYHIQEAAKWRMREISSIRVYDFEVPPSVMDCLEKEQLRQGRRSCMLETYLCNVLVTPLAVPKGAQ